MGAFTRLSPSKLLDDITALLTLGASKPNIEELRDMLISAFQNFRGAIYYSEVDAFVTGDNSIKSIATIELSAGHTIFVNIAGKIHCYHLKEATCSADISPYVIKPTDYDGDTNAKYWLKSGVWYQAITNANVVAGEYVPKHDLGVQFGVPVVFNDENYIIPQVDIVHVAGDETNYGYRATDADNAYYKFGSTITGTYKLLILY